MQVSRLLCCSTSSTCSSSFDCLFKWAYFILHFLYFFIFFLWENRQSLDYCAYYHFIFLRQESSVTGNEVHDTWGYLLMILGLSLCLVHLDPCCPLYPPGWSWIFFSHCRLGFLPCLSHWAWEIRSSCMCWYFGAKQVQGRDLRRALVCLRFGKILLEQSISRGRGLFCWWNLPLHSFKYKFLCFSYSEGTAGATRDGFWVFTLCGNW